MICALCNEEFEGRREYYRQCSSCYEEYGLIGDETQLKMIRAVSDLINLPLTMIDLKLLADSVAFFRFVEEVLMEKDLLTRGRWLLNEEKKFQKLVEK